MLLLDGRREPDTIDSFSAFASELGVLFQIVDDILDVTGSDARRSASRRAATSGSASAPT